MTTDKSIESLVESFSNFGIGNNSKIKDTCDDSMKLDELASSLGNLTLSCKNQIDIDDLCDKVDKICIDKDADSSVPILFKTIIRWQCSQPEVRTINLHIPTYGTCH